MNHECELISDKNYKKYYNKVKKYYTNKFDNEYFNDKVKKYRVQYNECNYSITNFRIKLKYLLLSEITLDNLYY